MFILPPSMAELERRLRRRATDAPEAIERRLATATRELEHFAEYDYLVVNDNLETALKELSSIYVAARCTRARREHYGRALLAEARSRDGGRASPTVAMSDVQEIVASGQAYDGAADTGLIERSFAFAAERHAGQKRRRSGDPYVIHPVGVARIIAELQLDVPSVCAGLLHDCVEDTSATVEDIGRAVRQGDRVPRRRRHQARQDPVDRRARSSRPRTSARCCSRWRATSASSSSSSPIASTTCGRSTYMPREKQERIARETREIYAPLANRLGIQWMKVELEDLAFKYLEPERVRSRSRAADAKTAPSAREYIDRGRRQADREALAENERRRRGVWAAPSTCGRSTRR